MQMPDISFEQWMAYGISKGWCGPPVCYSHDGIPTTPGEDDEWLEGGDPCMHIIRMYEDSEQKEAIEGNHAPSSWRNHYTQSAPNLLDSE